MTDLFHRLIDFVAGTSGTFDPAVWALITIGFLVMTAALTRFGRSFTDPPAVLLAVRMDRVLPWMAIAVVVTAAIIGLLFASVFASFLAVFVIFLAAAVAFVGYVSFAMIWCDRLARALGANLPTIVAALTGILILRLIRLIPAAGGYLQLLAVWIGFAAASAALWDKIRSWHQRRMPDDKQFPGERPIEWHEPAEK